eukprot:TRINITY_DN10921_c0_g1_i1.p1 TRINITY_DN10921_c0_g1~~TRINITY_DN10921_c0_g1_i1.p1  ORF type:complete len:157 (-),score=16.67 TRINITY_DN10921_c0_g1_i1:107-577(-)
MAPSSLQCGDVLAEAGLTVVPAIDLPVVERKKMVEFHGARLTVNHLAGGATMVAMDCCSQNAQFFARSPTLYYVVHSTWRMDFPSSQRRRISDLSCAESKESSHHSNFMVEKGLLRFSISCMVNGIQCMQDCRGCTAPFMAEAENILEFTYIPASA